MIYFCAEVESTTEGGTYPTEIGSTEIGTAESLTTGISTTEGMIYLSEISRYIKEVYCFIVCVYNQKL